MDAQLTAARAGAVSAYAQTKDEAQKAADQEWKQMDIESRRSLRKQREKLGVERTKLKLAWEAFERKYAKKVRRVLGLIAEE